MGKLASIARLALNLDAISADALKTAKGHPDQRLVQDIVRFSHSRRGGVALKLIDMDKRKLTRKLVDVPSNPWPLQIETFPTEGQAVEGCATPVLGARFLYAVVRSLKPKQIVEIGGAHGYGACCMATALKHANVSGVIDSLEGMKVRADHASDTVKRLGLDAWVKVHFGDFRETLPAVLSDQTRVVFSDGDKSIDLTRWHFELCLERMSEGYLIFDDIDFNPGIAALFSEFVAEPRISWALSFFNRWAVLKLEE
jgi:predicted O-methyltransferase YrrM